jgi:hypothetical protein
MRDAAAARCLSELPIPPRIRLQFPIKMAHLASCLEDPAGRLCTTPCTLLYITPSLPMPPTSYNFYTPYALFTHEASQQEHPVTHISRTCTPKVFTHDIQPDSTRWTPTNRTIAESHTSTSHTLTTLTYHKPHGVSTEAQRSAPFICVICRNCGRTST